MGQPLLRNSRWLTRLLEPRDLFRLNPALSNIDAVPLHRNEQEAGLPPVSFG